MNNNEDSSVIFNINKIKYDDIREYFPCEGLDGKRLHILIDADKIFEAFRQDYFKATCDKLISEKQVNAVASEFFNLVGHYRNFFKKINCRSTFTLVYSDRCDIKDGVTSYGSEWQPKYSTFTNPKAKQFIDFVVNRRIAVMCNMFPDVAVVTTNDVKGQKICKSLIINSIIDQFRDKDTVWLMTADPVLWQFSQVRRNMQVCISTSRAPGFLFRSEFFDFLTRKLKADYGKINDAFLLPYMVLMGNADLPPISKGYRVSDVLKIMSKLPEVSIPSSWTEDSIREIFLSQLKLATPVTDEQIAERLFLYDLSVTAELVAPETALEYTGQLIYDAGDFKEASTANAKYLNDAVQLQLIF